MSNKIITLEQSKAYAKNLETIVKQLKREVQKVIIKNSTIINGVTTIEAERLASVYRDIQTLIQDSGFIEATQNTVNLNQDILTDRLADLSKMFKNYNFGGLPLEKLQAITDLDLSTIGGQTELAYNELRKVIQLNVVNGVQFDKLVEDMDKILDGNLKHDAETLMRTAKRQFAQDLENLVADEIGFTDDDESMWEYIGDPLVPQSHDECIWALRERSHPYFTTEQKRDFELGIYPKHLAGRSAIRYNCHHNFWITSKTKSEVEKEFGLAE